MGLAVTLVLLADESTLNLNSRYHNLPSVTFTMKWLSALSALSLATVAAATPVPQLGQQLSIYRLKLESSFKTLHGRYLSVNTTSMGPGGTSRVGFFQKGQPLEVYTVKSPDFNEKFGLLELHTWPIGIVDHVIGIAGSSSMSSLVGITNPANPNLSTPKPPVVSWNMFHFDGNEKNGTVDYQRGSANWISRPVTASGYGVELWDGTGNIPQDYQRVTLKYELVKTTTEW